MKIMEEYESYIKNTFMFINLEKNIKEYYNSISNINIFKEIFAYFDADMFYASCEIKKNPELKFKPFFVGEKVVSCSSYLCRQFGIKSGSKIYEFKDIIEKNNIIQINADIFYYKKESKLIIDFLKNKFDNVRVNSIDEVYVKLDNFNNKSEEEIYNYFNDLKEYICNNLQHTWSIGVSFNPLIAKVCCNMAKPNGIFIKTDKNNFFNFYDNLSIIKLPGIGKKNLEIFNSLNMFKVCDIKNNINLLYYYYIDNKNKFKSIFYKIYAINKEKEKTDKKSLSVCKSISKKECYKNRNIGLIKDFCRYLHSKIINKNIMFKQIIFEYIDYKFKTFSISFNLIEYSNDLDVLIKKSLDLFNNFPNDKIFKNIGIRINKLINQNEFIYRNLSLINFEFENSGKENNNKIPISWNSKKILKQRRINQYFKSINNN